MKNINLDQFTENLAELFKSELVKSLRYYKKVASGSLIASIDYKVSKSQNIYKVGWLANKYIKWLNDGARWKKSPPPVKPLQDWARIKGFKNPERAGFAISRSMFNKSKTGWGIEPTPIIERAIEQTKKQVSITKLDKTLTRAILEDIKKEIIK